MGTADLINLLSGLGNGAVFAALALTLVVTYRSSGVVNFGVTAVALYVAYTYALLRDGKLLNPIPGFSATIGLGGKLGFVPALVIALLLAGLLGAVLYVVIFRPLRTAPAAAKAVASIGVLVVTQSLLAVRVGTLPVQTPAILPTRVYHFGSSPLDAVRGDNLWFTGIVVLMAVALTMWFRLTRFGIATRAAAESEKGALVTGLSPQRIALVNWAVSTAIAGLSGILIASISPALTPVGFTLFIVPALAAALAGNLNQVGVAVGAGLAIGMIQSEAVNRVSDLTWLPKAGSDDLVPLVIILIFLVMRGRGLPSRGAIIQQTLGRAPRPRSPMTAGVAILGLGMVGLATTGGSTRAALITSFILATIALSQVVVTGFSGQISLAQLTLAGVGAFSLTRIQTQLHVPFPFAPLLAALIAMALAVVVGLPALRIRGLPVAITSLALAVVLEHAWFNNAQFNGGYAGAPIKDPTMFGIDLGPGQGLSLGRASFGMLCLVVLLLVAGGVTLLRRSRLGAAMLAVRANERAAAAAGISVSRTKITAFAIGGFTAGLGGALLGYQQTLATTTSYTAIGGVVLFATAYLAGITSVSGGIVAGLIASGGVVFTLVDDGLPLGVYVLLLGLAALAIVAKRWPRTFGPGCVVLALAVAAGFIFGSSDVSLGTYYSTISGVLLILTVIVNPEGIVGPVHEQLDRVRGKLPRLRTRAATPAPATGSPATELVADARIHDPLPGPILTVAGVTVRYSAVVATDDVCFTVNSGEIVGLIGPNGAGKTTLIDALSGYADTSGRVTLRDHVLDRLKPYQRSRAGLGRTFQGIELYEDLTVRENVEVGTTAARFAPSGSTPSHRDIDRYFRILHLSDVADTPVRELSVGQRQLVSVARAMAGRPQVVLLDEPAAGLDTTESRWLGERLRAIRDAGITVVMVDHDMGLVLDICDRIVVLDLGKVIAIGTPADIQQNPEVTRAYLGTTHAHVEAVS